MKIGINALFFHPNEIDGLGVYTTRLVHHLTRMYPTTEFVLFISQESKDFFKDEPKNLKVVVLPVSSANKPLRVISEQLLLPWYILTNRIELLHSTAFTAPLFSYCPSVILFPDVGFRKWSERFSRFSAAFQDRLISILAKTCNRILTISNYAKQEISTELKIPVSKITTIPLSFDPDLFQRSKIPIQQAEEKIKHEWGIKKPYLLSVASHFPHKNLSGLVKAFDLLISEHQIPHNLVLVGHKRRAYPQLLELINSLGLQERIQLTGFVPDDCLPLIYTLADVFVFPSFYEGFGIPPLEAMACGTAVVSSNATSLPEVVGDAAVMVDPSDIQSIADGILKVITNPSYKQELIRLGNERVKQFSWEETARRTFEVYQNILDT